jgi:hypothetical protein
VNHGKVFMKTMILAILLIFLSNFATANDITIVDVRRNIPLSDEEPVYKDFYINGGSDDGLKKNLVVTVIRATNIRDASGAQSFGEILIPVGQVRILATYPKVSVAREYKSLSRDENPMLEQTGIMNGDKIDLKNSFVDTKPVRKPQAVVITVPLAPAVIVTPAPLVPPPVVAEAPKTETPAPAPVNNTTAAEPLPTTGAAN